MMDTIIIGGGPAGVTAALYTARAGLSTTILYKDHGALKKAKVENFYGHMEISGKQLVEIGLEQAHHVGANVLSEEAVGITFEQNFTIQTTTDIHTARAVILATGASRATPRIKGLSALEGRGVSYCAICDGFFHRGRDVAVLGHSAYAMHEIMDLLPIANSVTLLTNGKKPAIDFPDNVIVRTEKVKEVCAQDGMLGKTLCGVLLDGGDVVELSGLFIAIGVAGGVELARKLGAVVQNNAIFVDEKSRTTVDRLWAAGDCTEGLKQIAKAVADGAIAGTDVVKCLSPVS